MKINKYLANLIMLLVGIAILLFWGKEFCVFEGDSLNYLQAEKAEGIMPIYPIFLYICKRVFGYKNFLDATIYIQTFLAIFSVIFFSNYIADLYKLKNVEEIFIFVICLSPFCIYLPEYAITGLIITEGISYSVFYLFMTSCIKYTCNASYKNALIFWLFSIFMSLIRSQLLFTLVFFFVVFVITDIKKCGTYNIIKIIKSVGLSFVSFCIGIIVVMGFFRFYKTNINPYIRNYDEYTVASTDGLTKSIAVKLAKSGQINTLVKIKSFFEADEEDVQLFADEEEKELFLLIYKGLDENQYLHNYKREGLYEWIDLTKDRIPFVVEDAANNYFTLHPDTHLDRSYITSKMALVMLKKHWPQVLLHSGRIMIMSVVASVFFQIESIYLLCHIIAFGAYILFIILTLVNRKKHVKVYKFSRVILLFQILMIVITNMALNGVQRYVVYGMGVFYVGIYLNIRALYVDKLNEVSQ